VAMFVQGGCHGDHGEEGKHVRKWPPLSSSPLAQGEVGARHKEARKRVSAPKSSRWLDVKFTLPLMKLQ
jgi:hypothetical protein